jgi:hypothetical protein
MRPGLENAQRGSQSQESVQLLDYTVHSIGTRREDAEPVVTPISRVLSALS